MSSIKILPNGKILCTPDGTKWIMNPECCCDTTDYCIGCDNAFSSKLWVNFGRPELDKKPKSAMTKIFKTITYTSSGYPSGEITLGFGFDTAFGYKSTITGFDSYNFSATVPIEPDSDINCNPDVDPVYWASDEILLGTITIKGKDDTGTDDITCPDSSVFPPFRTRPSSCAISEYDLYMRFDCCGRLWRSYCVSGGTPPWSGVSSSILWNVWSDGSGYAPMVKRFPVDWPFSYTATPNWPNNDLCSSPSKTWVVNQQYATFSLDDQCAFCKDDVEQPAMLNAPLTFTVQFNE